MLKRLPLLIAVAALAVWMGDFIVRNFLAASLIEYGQDKASRDAAARRAPNNPAVIAARGKYLLYRADPPRREEAISDLKCAVLASPRDYRFWLELGRAYENIGEASRAETAMQRAADLAPRYFETRWALANLHLRAGKTEQALSDFREAIILSKGSVGEGEARPEEKATFNVLNTVAGAFGADPQVLRRVVPPDHISQGYLAGFLAERGELDQAMEIWRRLPPNDPDDLKSYRDVTVRLLRELQTKGRYADAREAWMKLPGVESESSNLITNSGFERKPLSELYPSLVESHTGFDWLIGRHREVRARRADSEKHTGSYSLQLTVAAAMQSEFQEVSQFVAVEPSQNYRLSYFIKTRNISPLPDEAPYIEICGVRSIAPSETTDWIEQSLSFMTPAETSGIRLTIRCPRLLTVDRARIAEVWFDDFKLEKEENAKHAK